MTPAQQSLDSSEGAGREAERGLVQQEELPQLHCSVQIHLQMSMVIDVFLHRGQKNHGTVLPSGLCLVEGDVGVPEELLGYRPRSLCDADARRYGQRCLASRDLKGSGQHV
jgi:hypothetical protein